MVSAALEQFRSAHGSYPDALSNLVPKYFPGPVLDPFSGEPIRYRKDETGIVLGSVGSPLNDNNSVTQSERKDREILFVVSRRRS
jgi:hypothetical protein